MLLIPYISRIIGIENYGKLEYARAFVYYFTIFVNYGFDLTATRSISVNRDNQNKMNSIITHILGLKLFFWVISFILFLLFLEINDLSPDDSLLYFVTFLITFGQALFPIWFFQGIEKISKIANINFVIKLVIVSAVLLFIHYKVDYWKYNLFLSLSEIIVGLYSLYVIVKEYKIKFVRIEKAELLENLKSGFSVFFTTVLVTIFVSYPFIISKKYATDLTLGEFSTGSKIVITVQTFLLLPFSQAFFPVITQITSTDLAKSKKYILNTAKIIFFVTFGFGVLLFFFGEEIITILYGKDYIGGYRYLKIMAFLPMFSILNNLFAYQGLLSLNKDRVFLYIHIIFTLLIISVSYVLIPHYSLIATSYIRILGEIVLTITSFLFYIKILNRRIESELNYC